MSAIIGNRVFRSVLTSLLLASMLTISAPLTMAQGANGVTVSVNAPDYVTPLSTFIAKINITEVANFDSASYDVSFNPSIVEVTSITGGKIGETDIPVNLWNETELGTIRIAQNIPGITGVSGSGYLAEIYFHVLGSPGQSSNITLANGRLGDNTAQAIPATWTGDLVRITAHETATVSINAPEVVYQSSNFSATIDISQVTNFDAANYDVFFDPAVVKITGVTGGRIGEITIPVNLWNEAEPGRIRVVQNIPGVQGTSGAGSLATLGFHVLGADGQSSNITLSNGVLSDGTAQIIPAEWIGDSVLIPGIAVATNAADNITTSSVRLNGSLVSLGTASSANVSFQWGLTDNYTYETIPVSMNTTGPFSYVLTDLSANTTYHFRAKAAGDNMTVYGGGEKL